MSNGDTVSVYAAGDVSPRRIDYGEAPESLFAKVVDTLKQSDISLCQLECNLSTQGGLQYRHYVTWYGRAHPDNVKSLVHGGFTLVTHASNHCFDYGPDALVETIDVLRRNGIQVAGVGKDLQEATAPVIVERKNTKIAFLNYNSVLPDEYEAREQKAGCAAVKVGTYYEPQEYQAGTLPKVVTIPKEEDVMAMEENIRSAKAQADIVIVSLHWGIHHIPGMLADYQFTLGHRAIDAGADLILGTHAHLIKGIEVYKGKVIFFSLGNFAQETPHHLKPPPGAFSSLWGPKYGHSKHEPGFRYNRQPDKRYTMLAKCVIEDKSIVKVSFAPGWINDLAEPRLLKSTEPEFKEVTDYMNKWCQELGTRLSIEGDDVVVFP
jgi:poly-gamma-glutamate capsule biosynthesis protein CapA/YwtB (metallophosphatase superfamily)